MKRRRARVLDVPVWETKKSLPLGLEVEGIEEEEEESFLRRRDWDL